MTGSLAAGRAWQTTLGAYLPLVQGSAVASDPAHALVLQLPLEGVLAKGGALNFVLKRPQGMHPEWLQGSGNHDFRISFEKVWCLFPLPMNCWGQAPSRLLLGRYWLHTPHIGCLTEHSMAL